MALLLPVLLLLQGAAPERPAMQEAPETDLLRGHASAAPDLAGPGFAIPGGRIAGGAIAGGDGPGEGTAAAQGDATGEPVDDRRALIIGISDYDRAHGPDGAWKDLPGAVKDAEAMREVLVDRFGFPPGQVILLLDGDATHENIVRTFYEHLVLPSGPDTEAVFYFAGHGSRVPDASGAGTEMHDEDSTLVPYDGRVDAGGRCFDLTDDELHSMLRALGGRTQRITVITDACHSSGNTRGPQVRRARAIPAGPRPMRFEDLAGFWPEDVAFLDDDDPRRLEPLPHVHIAACGAGERAYEVPIRIAANETEPRGNLTWHLDAELRRAEPGDSYQEVMARVAERVRGQQVQAAGPAERLLFSGEFSAPLPGFGGRLTKSGRFASLDAGTLHLVREGAVFAVSTLEGEELGLARARSVGPQECELTWTTRKAPAAALALGEGPVRAVLRSQPAQDPALSLALPEHPQAAAIARALQEEEGVHLSIVPREAAQLILHVAGDGDWQLWDVETDVMLARATIAADEEVAPAVAAAFADALRTEHRYRALERLATLQGPVPLDARLEEIPPGDLAAIRRSYDGRYVAARVQRVGGQGLGTSSAGRLQVVPDPDPEARSLVMLRVSQPEGPNARPVHLSVLCLSENREVNLIFPEPGDRENVLEPGKELTIPFVAYRNPGWRLDRDLRDRYLVIGTDAWADFSPLELPGLLVERPRVRGRGLPGSDLPTILEQAIYGSLTRGGHLRRDEPGFAITSFDAWVGTSAP